MTLKNAKGRLRMPKGRQRSRYKNFSITVNKATYLFTLTQRERPYLSKELIYLSKF
jgi:hypothetical protein